MNTQDDSHCGDDDPSELKIPLLFGRFLVHSGVIGEKDLEHALEVQLELNHQIGCAALESGVISLAEWQECRRHQREHAMTFVETVSALGLLDKDGHQRLRDIVIGSHLHLEEVLVKRGALQTQQLESLMLSFSEQGYF